MTPTFEQVMSNLYFRTRDADSWDSLTVLDYRPKRFYILSYADSVCQFEATIDMRYIQEGRWNVVDRALYVLHRAVVKEHKRQEEAK